MVKMDFDEQGRRTSSYGQLLVMSERGRGRPKKLDTTELDQIALSKPANDCPPLQQKRSRGRPRKNPVEAENQVPSKPASNFLIQKRGRGRPKKLDTAELDQIALSKPANDCPPLQQKRSRGRPRKNPVEAENQVPSKPASNFLIQKRDREITRKNPIESEIQINLKENYISDVKEKLKLLESITNGYREIERIDEATQKNVEKLCAMTHNSK